MYYMRGINEIIESVMKTTKARFKQELKPKEKYLKRVRNRDKLNKKRG